MTLSLFLSYFSGLHWIAPELDGSTLWRTVLLIHFCDAGVCLVVARNHNYDTRRWAVLGFLFGVWTITVLLIGAIVSERRASRG